MRTISLLKALHAAFGRKTKSITSIHKDWTGDVFGKGGKSSNSAIFGRKLKGCMLGTCGRWLDNTALSAKAFLCHWRRDGSGIIGKLIKCGV